MLSRRSFLASSALALAAGRTFAQEAPPIEDAGPLRLDISPEAVDASLSLPPDWEGDYQIPERYRARVVQVAPGLVPGEIHIVPQSYHLYYVLPGDAAVRYGATHINAMVNVTGAAAALPHAQHIHFGRQAMHECPTARLDTDRNFRLNVAEGVPAYGPIAVSLTTTGNTGDASGLAVDRMPVAAANGSYSYYRTGIRLVPSMTESAAAIRAGIAAGQGVVVIHGVDHNGNGQYDMAGAGASELNPAVPAEATDPAACGLLE